MDLLRLTMLSGKKLMSCMHIPSTMKDVIHAIQGWAVAWFFYPDEDTARETIFYKTIQSSHIGGDRPISSQGEERI